MVPQKGATHVRIFALSHDAGMHLAAALLNLSYYACDDPNQGGNIKEICLLGCPEIGPTLQLKV